jgi:hypothetical protein
MIRVFVCIICNLHGSYCTTARLSLLCILPAPSLLDDSNSPDCPRFSHSSTNPFVGARIVRGMTPHGRSSTWRSRSIAPKLSKNDLNRSI